MITFLKLGGSLITDKTTAHTPRAEVIRSLAGEIREAWNSSREPLIIGHGSGSFGHVPAKKYGTRNGVRTDEEWAGFAEVHAEATALNRIVLDILREAGLPVLSIVPMDAVRARDGIVSRWNTDILESCFSKGLIPLIFGDTVFDEVRGGTILSTEDLFMYLCENLDRPSRVLLAGLEKGVWKDFPHNTELIREISASESDINDGVIKGSAFTDVTGGMFEKVRLMKELVREGETASAMIFSGGEPGNVKKALEGQSVGTIIRGN